MSPARQLAELGPRGDGYCREPKWWQLFLNIVPGTRSGGSGQTVGELGPCQEVWSHPAAAAAHWLAAHVFSSPRIPIQGARPGV